MDLMLKILIYYSFFKETALLLAWQYTFQQLHEITALTFRGWGFFISYAFIHFILNTSLFAEINRYEVVFIVIFIALKVK